MNRGSTAAIDRFVDRHQKEMIADLDALVRIPSVSIPGGQGKYPFGAPCAAVLDKALELAQKSGMQTEDHGGRYALAWRGRGTHTVGIFAHLDVVDAADDWSWPPYQVTEKDGWLIGRGVADDKCAAVIGMYTARALDALGLGEHIKLMLYLGCCEEKGMSDLDTYLSEHDEPEFSLVPDYRFPVSIGEPGCVKLRLRLSREGIHLQNFKGGGAGQRVPLGASVILPGADLDALSALAAKADAVTAAPAEGGVKLSAAGRPDLFPGANDGVNAIGVLADFLASSGLLAEREEALMEALMEVARSTDGACFDIACQNERYGRLQCAARTVEQDETGMYLSIDIRYPDCTTGKTILSSVEKYCAARAWELVKAEDIPPWLFPAEDPRVQILCQSWNDVSGRKDAPRVGGGTYAKKLKNAVSFGPKDDSSCPFLPAGHGAIHSPDEALRTQTLLNAVKVYIRAFAKLDEWYGAQGWT